MSSANNVGKCAPPCLELAHISPALHSRSGENDYIPNNSAKSSASVSPANNVSVQGSYGRIAALMGYSPELGIFRKFKEINIRNLLNSQSELVYLEREYNAICEEDAASECAITRSYQYDWAALQESKGLGGTLQKDAQLKLQTKLVAYSKMSSAEGLCHDCYDIDIHGLDNALLQLIELCKQAGPSQFDLQSLRHWLISSKGNNSDLEGPGWDVWEAQDNHHHESKMQADLVVLSAKHNGQDYLLKLMGERVFRLLYRLPSHQMKVLIRTHTCVLSIAVRNMTNACS